MPQSYQTFLAIILTIINPLQNRIGKHFGGANKIHSMRLNVSFPLALVPFKSPYIIYLQL